MQGPDPPRRRRPEGDRGRGLVAAGRLVELVLGVLQRLLGLILGVLRCLVDLILGVLDRLIGLVDGVVDLLLGVVAAAGPRDRAAAAIAITPAVASALRPLPLLI